MLGFHDTTRAIDERNEARMNFRTKPRIKTAIQQAAALSGVDDSVFTMNAAYQPALAQEGAYDGVVFHRVIDGFMAQTGDVEFGKTGGDLSGAGMGGSAKPDLAAEFSSMTFDRGVVGMARSMDPNSANSQFFIMFAPAPHLDGQYTVVGRVISGMEVVDAIKKGDQAANGAVDAPDYMAKVTVAE